MFNHPKLGPPTQCLDQVMIRPKIKKYFFSLLLSKFSEKMVIWARVGFCGPFFSKLVGSWGIWLEQCFKDLPGCKTSKYEVETPRRGRGVGPSKLHFFEKITKKMTFFSHRHFGEPISRDRGGNKKLTILSF